jgi:uncharacterized protein YjbI with pentapeptide repeats
MKVKNLTGFPFGAKVTARKPPSLEMVLVVRGTFVLRPGEPIARKGDPGDLVAQGPMTAEVFRPNDLDRAGECLTPNDFADWKPRSEALLVGSCHTPGGKALTECPVRFSVGALSKSLQVTGRRAWSDSFSGAERSAPLPFVRMPLDWAHAFGGSGFADNPVGRGLDHELPNVENARELVRTRSDRPAPAGFGPVSPEWPLRKNKRGTLYGRAWRKERAPFFAEDFDWSHFNAAPLDQQIHGFWRGDERLELVNLVRGAPVFEGTLPGLRVRAFVKDTTGRFREVPMGLDTIFVSPDEESLQLTWRGLDRVETDDLTDVATVLLAHEALASEPLATEHYREQLEAFERDPLGLPAHRFEPSAELAAGLAKLEAMKAAAAEAKAAEGSMAATKALGALLSILSPPGAAELRAKLDEVGRTLAEKTPNLDTSAAVKAGFNTPPATRSNADLGAKQPRFLAPGQEATARMREQLGQARDAAARAGKPFPKEADEALAHPLFAPSPEGPPVGPGVELGGRDFSGQDLRAFDFRGADLTRANFTGARLDGAKFQGANLHQAIVADASLEETDFESANLDSTNFTGSRGPRASFRRAHVGRAMFDGATLPSASFDDAEGESPIFQGTILVAASFRGVRFVRALFQSGDSSDADFTEAALTRSLFQRASLARARFDRASLDWVGFLDSALVGASFVEARGRAASFQNTLLEEADLSFAILRSTHFSGSDLTRAKLVAAILRGARFYRAKLTRADLSHADLFEADLRKVELTGAVLRHASLYGAALGGASGRAADLTHANLKRSTLEDT